MKLRLFAIRKASEQQHGTTFFRDQMVARKERDRLTTNTGEPHVVCPGPDHKRYKEAESEVS